MRRFGLIGYPLTHSFSQKYFTDKFEQEKIKDAVYENFPLQEITELKHILSQHADLRGLNVTIPYKKLVLPYLTKASEAVQQMGACNCIRIEGSVLEGFNTDVFGFEQSLAPFLKSHHKQALVLGTGGAAAAVEYVLNRLGIPFQSVSRTPDAGMLTYSSLDAEIMASHQLIINTSPVGMYPDTNAFPDIPYQYLTAHHHVYDLIYNPIETTLLQKAREQGATTQNGAEMLVLQAEESWRIWK